MLEHTRGSLKERKNQIPFGIFLYHLISPTFLNQYVILKFILSPCTDPEISIANLSSASNDVWSYHQNYSRFSINHGKHA
jgi:hypothetical protein